MLTSVYNGAFTRRLKGSAQGPGFEGCFAREQDGNRRKSTAVDKSAVMVW
jgi:hypothetical protein